MKNSNVKRLCITSLMLALGTVLSIFKFKGIWAFGGGVTACSMLPLILLSYFYGTKWGLYSSFIYSIIQLILGSTNIQYATSINMAVFIIFLDYILAYSVIGFSSAFKGKFKNNNIEIIIGIIATFLLRFLFHFLSGWMIWDRLWPNEFNMISPIYSFYYNFSYMLPETIATSIAAVIIIRMLKKIDGIF